MNTDRQGFDGYTAKLFYVWCAIIRTVKPYVCFHENVPSFGDQEIRELLGSMYIVVRIQTCPSELGLRS